MTAPEVINRLVIDKIAVRFGGLVAIANMTFTVESGTIVSLIGPNGAGKTTAFNVITGFMRPTSGRVLYKGCDLTRMSSSEVAELGVVRTFQRTSIFNYCTVFESVLTSLHLRGRTEFLGAILRTKVVKDEEEKLREQAMLTLKFVGLESRKDVIAKNLSYGEQRHLALAMALAAEPSILLLDEPAAGLNLFETHRFMDLVQDIRQQGMTILFVEHDMHMVMSISDRVFVLNNGHIIASGSPREVQNDPAVIRAYLGQGLGDVKN